MTLLAVLTIPLALAAPSQAETDELAAAVREALQQGDSGLAAARITDGREPREAAGLFIDLAGQVFQQDKDLTGSALLSLAGIHYCLSRADGLEETDAELTRLLRRTAMAIAYNLAANAWPGWAEEGIAIDATARAIGLDAARLNLRLARELEMGLEAEANGLWIVGAQLMASDRLEDAARAFQAAEALYAEAKAEEYRLMAHGYDALTALLSGVEGGEASFEATLSDLRRLDTEDSRFFADQLAVAREVFLP